jgi:DNA-binding MarR family transcriptional regulator
LLRYFKIDYFAFIRIRNQKEDEAMMDIRLEDVVNHRVSMLAVLMKRHVFKILAEKNLKITPDQWVVMYYLWQENGLSIGEIAKRSKKDFANVTRIVDKLKKREYVTKKKSNTDGRISNVFILPKADEIKTEIQECWKRAAEIALDGINKTEQQRFMDTLIKIENNVLRSLDSDFDTVE